MSGGAIQQTDSPTTRTEQDRLGALEIPADALWGIHTARSLAALSHSGRRLGDLPALVRGLGRVKAAAALANERASVLDRTRASAIVDAADELADGAHAAALVADPLAGGGAIAVHANVNEVVANLAGLTLGSPLGTYRPVHPTTTVSASQSTADVVHTATRLAIIDGVSEFDATLGDLVAALTAVAERFGSAPTLARTCLQDGLAVESRLLFDGAAAAVARRRASLRRSVEPLHEVVLGSTVIGTGEGAPPAYREAVVGLLAERAGRPLVEALLPASSLQHGDDVLEVASAVAQVGAVAAKVARDLRLLASGPAGGFGEVGLPAVMEGSAFFVDKVNPAVPETVIQAAAQAEGFLQTARSASAGAELHLHPYDLAAGVAVLDQLATLDRSMTHLVKDALAGLVLQGDRTRELAAGARSTKVGP